MFVPVGVVCFHFICNRQSDKTLATFFLTSTLLFLLPQFSRSGNYQDLVTVSGKVVPCYWVDYQAFN